MTQASMFGTNRTAIFSPCRRWRYVLTIRFNDKQNPRMVCFIMLNPSTADEVNNDPTVERCERRARAMGFDGVVILNLFAWRATVPSAMKDLANPIGQDNDRYIVEQASQAELVVCGWGSSHPVYRMIEVRAARVCDMLRGVGLELYYLRMGIHTRQPSHPLYLPYSEEPKLWTRFQAMQ